MQHVPVVLVSACVTAVSVGVALNFAHPRRPLPYTLAKAAASVGFVVAAVAVGALAGSWTRLALYALSLSALGDVVLGGRGTRAFLGGLGIFAAAHVVFSAAFLTYGAPSGTLVLVAVLVAFLGAVVWLWMGETIPRPQRLPVGVYLTVICLMAATGLTAGIVHRSPLLVVGVLSVVASDLAVARERFVRSTFRNKLFGLPIYYLGQMLIALSLAWG